MRTRREISSIDAKGVAKTLLPKPVKKKEETKKKGKAKDRMPNISLYLEL